MDGLSVSPLLSDEIGLHDLDSDEMLPLWLWELGWETCEKDGEAAR